jgi:predicted NBD/HSP70 family sugar kinase
MTRLAGSSSLLRAMNESAALALLLEHGELTRSQLRDLTGLSKPTVSVALRRLTEAGLARIVRYVSAGPGPNAEAYAANPDAAYTVAVCVREIAGTARPSLLAAVCDLGGTVRGRRELAVDFPHADPVSAVADVVRRLCEDTGIAAGRVGHLQVSVPGGYDPRTDTIHHVDVPGRRQAGLAGELRRRLRTGVGVDHDVNLAAMAERRHGVGHGTDGFALLWLDEVVGLAIDLGGSLLRGARGGAGEIGHMALFVPDAGGGPRPAKIDFQDLVGGCAVAALAAEHGVAVEDGVPADTARRAVAAAVRATVEPRPRPAAQTAGSAVPAGTGRGAAAMFLDALADRVAVGVAAIVAVLDPPLVVLGGDLARAGGTALGEAVTAAVRRTAQPDTAVAVTAIQKDAVLLGALDAGLAAIRESVIGSVHRLDP